MADRLSITPVLRTSLLALACLFSAGAQAQASGLADPTRPPPGVDGGAPLVETGSSLLQSVLIPKKGRPVAVIGGQAVPLGGKYGDSTLVAINEREVVLDGPDGVERLRLTPAVEKTMIKHAPARKARGGQE